MTTEPTKEDIRSLYREFLLREADHPGLRSYLKSGLNINEIRQQIINSNEYRNHIYPIIEDLFKAGEKKVLLFGAYGNGNLGDAIQATFLERCIRQSGFNGQVWATSFLSGNFHFTAKRKLPPLAIKSSDILEQFDLIIIGGGGLLSHPHHPLNDTTWAQSLRTPTALVSVGATNKSAPDSSYLIKRSVFVSARDKPSYECLKQFRDDVYITKDPVLSMQEYPSKNSCIEERTSTAWILKGPITATHHVIRDMICSQDTVIGFEPRVDNTIEELFPEIIYTPTVHSFTNQVMHCNRVFSMRYHGLILSMPFTPNLFAIGDQKNRELLREIGLPSHFLDNPKQLSMPPKDTQKRTRHSITELASSSKVTLVAHLKNLLLTLNA